MTETLYEQVKNDLYKTSVIGNAKRYNEKVKENKINRSLLEDVKNKKHPEKKHITLDNFFI